MKKYFKILVLILSPLIITGCQKKDSRPTMEVQHQYGVSKVPINPQRVITLMPGDFETSLALGVKPIATSIISLNGRCENDNYIVKKWNQDWINNYDVNYNPERIYVDYRSDHLNWEEESLETREKKVETIHFYYKQIKELKPDLIIAPFSNMDENTYKKVSKIAPTVPSLYDYSQNQRWQDATRLVAACLNKREEGEELIRNTEQLIRAKISSYPALKDKTFAYFQTKHIGDNRAVKIASSHSYAVNFVNDLGIKIDPDIVNMSSNEGFITMASDNISSLQDTDIIIVESNQELSSLIGSELVMQSPAAQNGAIARISNTNDLSYGTIYPSVLSIPYFIDEYLNILNDAALKVN